MKTNIYFKIISVFLCFSLFSCSSNEQKLFNGKDLKNWDVYIGKPYYTQGAQVPKGDIFTVVTEDGEPAIRISGVVNASLCTKEEYSNYRLTLEFKYGDEVYDKRNSGLLYHSFGDFGNAIDTWKSSIECQMMDGEVGSMYSMGDDVGTFIKSSPINDDTFVYNHKADQHEFSSKSESGKYCTQIAGHEKAIGEWNKLELYCYDDDAIHKVNGRVVCEVNDIFKMVDGRVRPLEKGQIQLQSEGSELFVRNIVISPISELP